MNTSLSVGDTVKILRGKYKNKIAVIKEISLLVCCFIDNSFYMWFFPSSLEHEEWEDADWGGNGDYVGDERCLSSF